MDREPRPSAKYISGPVAGAIDGLSIGFKTGQARVDPKTRVRRVYAVDLWEISIVTFPLLNGARVSSTRGASHGVRMSEPLLPEHEERFKRRHSVVPFARAKGEREWKAVSGRSGRHA